MALRTTSLPKEKPYIPLRPSPLSRAGGVPEVGGRSVTGSLVRSTVASPTEASAKARVQTWRFDDGDPAKRKAEASLIRQVKAAAYADFEKKLDALRAAAHIVFMKGTPPLHVSEHRDCGFPALMTSADGLSALTRAFTDLARYSDVLSEFAASKVMKKRGDAFNGELGRFGMYFGTHFSADTLLNAYEHVRGRVSTTAVDHVFSRAILEALENQYAAMHDGLDFPGRPVDEDLMGGEARAIVALPHNLEILTSPEAVSRLAAFPTDSGSGRLLRILAGILAKAAPEKLQPFLEQLAVQQRQSQIAAQSSEVVLAKVAGARAERLADVLRATLDDVAQGNRDLLLAALKSGFLFQFANRAHLLASLSPLNVDDFAAISSARLQSKSLAEKVASLNDEIVTDKPEQLDWFSHDIAHFEAAVSDYREVAARAVESYASSTSGSGSSGADSDSDHESPQLLSEFERLNACAGSTFTLTIGSMVKPVGALGQLVSKIGDGLKRESQYQLRFSKAGKDYSFCISGANSRRAVYACVMNAFPGATGKTLIPLKA